MVRKWKAYVAYAFLACSAAGLNIISDSQADHKRHREVWCTGFTELRDSENAVTLHTAGFEPAGNGWFFYPFSPIVIKVIFD